MHLVRLGGPSSGAGADLRGALSACGPGSDMLGGLAVLGPSVPGHTVEAVLVAPRGLVVVVAVDLPDPAMRVEAPLDGPWLVDGWVLRRADGAVNPVDEARAATAAVRRLAGDRPGCGALIALGPFAERVVQPPDELDRGVRVVHPSRRSVRDAVHGLLAASDPIGPDRAAGVLAALGCPPPQAAVLAAEGFTVARVPAPPAVPVAREQRPATAQRWRQLGWVAAGTTLAVLLSITVAALL
ncbi:MAG: hypothetical protein ACRDRZ_06360 [Pseudonocardiaceae bacterium]